MREHGEHGPTAAGDKSPRSQKEIIGRFINFVPKCDKYPRK